MFPLFQTLLARMEDGVIAVASLNRPGAANALNTQTALELKDLFASLPPSYRVVVLTGEGKNFCAGADLRERRGMDEKAWHAQHDALEAALQAVLACPVPVIAAVQGAAFGGGLELALACDFIYAAANARFALTETTLGIMPGMGGTQQLPRAVGLRRAREAVYTGRPFSAQDALQWGMVNKISAPEALMEDALSCARTVASNAPLAIKAVKQAMNEGYPLPLDAALRCELAHYNTLLTTKDREEGIAAYNEQRKPVFTGE